MDAPDGADRGPKLVTIPACVCGALVVEALAPSTQPFLVVLGPLGYALGARKEQVVEKSGAVQRLGEALGVVESEPNAGRKVREARVEPRKVNAGDGDRRVEQNVE